MKQSLEQLELKLTAMLTILEGMPLSEAKRDLVILIAECSEIIEPTE